ncbi:hypothetical protein [Thalassomonas actiniarum]|uniref:Tat pathway signal protein n=1 Tax=Thalassomonas actiniarum TaxID=485447 RepID=A0AAF0C227_9GAMM|nr:hypothetical protein [Thalassomonas actiniarum]WDD99621.1 Tat pathway signal protein [Thalassomonas actiniarum]
MTTYTVCFAGTGCSRDEGELTRNWARRDWQLWLNETRLKSDKRIYRNSTGYIPVRLHMEISGALADTDPSATVRGVGENDWNQQMEESDPLLIEPLEAPKELLNYIKSYSKGNQRSVPSQLTGWASAALALHGANLAEKSGATQINFVGHSRGAVQAIMAAWFLYAYSKKKIPVNIFAIDPVPGTGEWYSIQTQLAPNVANYVGVYAWDHLDVGFSALVPRPNAKMTEQDEITKLGKHWKNLAKHYQLADPLARGERAQPTGYELYACRGRHGTVAGNTTSDGLYDPGKASDLAAPVPELIYKMARGYLTKWGTTFETASAVEESILELRRKIHTDHATFDAMGCGETRTSRLPSRPYVRQVSSISGRKPWDTYYLDDVAGDPPYKLAFPVTVERKNAGWVNWKFL